MQIPKPSDADKERFRSVLPPHPDVVVKLMFGNLGAFVGGNMFAGLFGSTVGVRLSAADRAQIGAEELTVPFGPAEWPMREYVGLPEIWQNGDDTALWVAKAYSYVAGLPPKAPKPRARQ